MSGNGRMNYYGGGGWPSNQQQSWPYGGGRGSANPYSNYGSQQQPSYGSQTYGSSSGGYSQQSRSVDQGYADSNSMRRGGNRASWQEQPQAAAPVQRNPVRRVVNSSVRSSAVNSNSRQQQQQRYNNPPVVSDDEDDSDYFSSGIRPVPVQQQRAATVKKIPTTNASSFGTTETALCLVPQTPSITEITRLLKGDKGDPGTPGDNFFEQTGEEVKLLRGSNMTIPGVLRASSLEISNPKGPLIMAVGEGVTGEDGKLTIQLSREIKGTWNKENSKILLTARQPCAGLFLPMDGMEPEHNQFTVHCCDKQRIAFDWVMIRF